ncbi:uncharacterized protein LOC135826046 isoform X2 [Sycon ciliatum]|uniref:uncharacterized protein LOC135826046 isoform X2 n=1 Tax=Sycon ciliatum TaxID=27933 RepID=UPI0031F623AC
MAPETFPWSAAEGQCVGYDSSIDIFAFGVLATAVLTGRLPDPQIRLAPYFRENASGEKVPILELERRKAELDRLDDGHALKPIVLRCLSNDPTQRPSAFELHEHILRWLGEAEDTPEQDTIEKTVADARATSQLRMRWTRQQNTPPSQQEQERALAPNTASLLEQWNQIAAPWETSLDNVLYSVAFREALFCFFTPDSGSLSISYTDDVNAALGVAWHAVEVPKDLRYCRAVYAHEQHIPYYL